MLTPRCSRWCSARNDGRFDVPFTFVGPCDYSLNRAQERWLTVPGWPSSNPSRMGAPGEELAVLQPHMVSGGSRWGFRSEAVMPFVEVPGINGCAIYRPGHAVHFIQARLSWEAAQRQAPEIGQIFAIEDGLITVVLEDGVRHFQNHDLVKVRQAVAEYGRTAAIQTHGILKIGEFAKFCVKVADGEPLDRCRRALDQKELFRRIGETRQDGPDKVEKVIRAMRAEQDEGPEKIEQLLIRRLRRHSTAACRAPTRW